MKLRLIFATALLASVEFTAQGGLVYDNGPLNISNSITGFGITSGRVADDFVLGTPATIALIRFWLFTGDAPRFSGTVSYGIYQNSAGSLGTLIASGSTNPTVNIITLGLVSQVPQLDVTLTSAVPLAAGAYWLEMHEGSTLTTNDGSEVSWVARNGVTGNAKQDSVPTLPTTSISSEMGFQLFDTAAPEPSTGILIVSALSGLALVRRRACS
jgi:hypothetical protein